MSLSCQHALGGRHAHARQTPNIRCCFFCDALLVPFSIVQCAHFFILPLLLLSGSPAQLQQKKRNKEEENTNQDDKHYKATGSLGLGSSDHGGVSALT